MAGTRNKFMYSEFCVDLRQTTKQKDYLMNPDPCVNNRPALPIGYNAPRMPATLLANNAVDIESSLYGISANNYIFPQKKVSPQPVHLQTVKFYDMTECFVPILPDPLKDQRPTGF